MSAMTVGEVRTMICQWTGVPHKDTTHYVIVVHDMESGQAGLLYCCDDQRDTIGPLRRAIDALTGNN